MSEHQIALLLHIVGAIVYFAGLTVATVALVAAGRRERPSEIALLLRLTPYGVILVAIGFMLILGFGLWLLDLTPADFDQTWISAALGLLLVSFVLGAVGGRKPKQARLLATKLAGEDDQPSLELRQLLTDPVATLLNVVAALASIAALVLMVWRPGS